MFYIEYASLFHIPVIFPRTGIPAKCPKRPAGIRDNTMPHVASWHHMRAYLKSPQIPRPVT
ncbi:hypothetical protein BGC30_02150 [Novacetimonas hansenii]|nr:hypothetical protein BGC30_02150 [Novacetimonas hansenii]